MAIGFTNDRFKAFNERLNYTFCGQNAHSKIYTYVNTGQTNKVLFTQRGGTAVPSTGFRFGGATAIQQQPQQQGQVTCNFTDHFVKGDVLGFCWDSVENTCQLFKNGEKMYGACFRNLSILQNRGPVYFFVELSVSASVRVYMCVVDSNNNLNETQVHGDEVHSVRFPKSKEEANELKKELELLPKDEDIAELMKLGAKDVETAKTTLFKSGGNMQRAIEILTGAPATSTTGGFGKPAHTVPGFRFGATPRSLFGQHQTTPQTSLTQPKSTLANPPTQQKIGGIAVKKAGTFVFGGNATSAKTTTTTNNKTLVSFGTATNKPAFGFGATTKKPAFSFGTTTNKPASSTQKFTFNSSVPKTNSFKFGTGNTTSQAFAGSNGNNKTNKNNAAAGGSDSNQPAKKKQKT